MLKIADRGFLVIFIFATVGFFSRGGFLRDVSDTKSLTFFLLMLASAVLFVAIPLFDLSDDDKK